MAAEILMRRALRYWRRGEPLPLDLYAELLALGINVEALETKHRIS